VSGKVYGLDMTEDMISLARRNAEEAGVTNVEYLLGTMESIPLPNGSVDVIISNCVLNLASDKDVVFREAYRVLKNGGEVAIADIVLKRALPEDVMKSMEMWTGCVSGALLQDEYLKKLYQAGFSEVSMEEVKVYTDIDVLLPLVRSNSVAQGNVQC
jgi:arsenite methyltransferase